MAVGTRTIFALISSCLLAPLVAHGTIGAFSRFMADDYCSAAVARSQGLIGGTMHWYTTWNGRYAANFFDSLAGLLGTPAVVIGPGLVLALWLALLASAIALFIPPGSASPRLAAVSLAAGVIFATLNLAPTVPQSLYWGQGMRSVLPPLLLLTASLVLLRLLAARPRALAFTLPACLLGAGLILLAAGFNETFTAVQVALFGASVLGVWLWSGPARRALPALLVGFAAALVGLALMVTAPGNAFRQAYFPPPPEPLALLTIAGRAAWEVLLNVILPDPLALLSVLGLLSLSAFAGTHTAALPPAVRRRVVLALGWLPLMALLLVYLCFVPAAYGMSNEPPPRTLIIPAYLLACAVALCGYLGGRLLAGTRAQQVGRTLWAGGAIALALVAVWSAADVLSQLPAHRVYAATWDATDAQIRAAQAAGEPAIVVPLSANLAGLEDPTADPSNWVNLCVSDYYGIVVTTAP